jgi:transposase-like protein
MAALSCSVTDSPNKPSHDRVSAPRGGSASNMGSCVNSCTWYSLRLNSRPSVLSPSGLKTMKSLDCAHGQCPMSGKASAGSIIRYGFYRTKSGTRRRFRCRTCGKTFCSNRGTPYHRVPRNEADQDHRDNGMPPWSCPELFPTNHRRAYSGWHSALSPHWSSSPFFPGFGHGRC